MKYEKWLTSEIRLLRERYATTPLSEMAKLIPRHSPESISSTAHNMGFARPSSSSSCVRWLAACAAHKFQTSYFQNVNAS